MTVREMQIAFDMHIQLISGDLEIDEKPDSYTVLYFLNLSQTKYIKETFLSKGQIEDNIEFIQKRSDTLRDIIARYNDIESATPISTTTVDGGIELSLPTNYLYYMKSFSYATNSLNNVLDKTWTPNRVVTYDEIDNITNGLNNTPILRKPCVVFEEGDKVVLYKDIDTDIYNISYIYLRKPLELSIETPIVNETTNECELDDYTHQDIVELAAKMFIEDYKFKASNKQ